MNHKPHLADPLPSLSKLERAEKAALHAMDKHGYRDPRLALVKGNVDDFDKIKEYDQKLAFYRHVALRELDREVTVNVPRPHQDWVNSSYG